MGGHDIQHEAKLLFIFCLKVGKLGCTTAGLVDANAGVLNVTKHLNGGNL